MAPAGIQMVDVVDVYIRHANFTRVRKQPLVYPNVLETPYLAVTQRDAGGE